MYVIANGKRVDSLVVASYDMFLTVMARADFAFDLSGLIWFYDSLDKAREEVRKDNESAAAVYDAMMAMLNEQISEFGIDAIAAISSAKG